MGHGPDIAN